MKSAGNDIFGPGSNLSVRFVKDLDTLKARVRACRELGLTIVLTAGTFDLLHVGHSRYLERAKEHGDILIVGVDDDEKTRVRKGPHRPVVSEDERLEILAHLRHVDLVVLKREKDPKWALIKAVEPDVLIATQGTYSSEKTEELKEWCKEVIVLEPQAITSTTARIRLLYIKLGAEVKKHLEAATKAIDRLIGDG